MLKIYNTLSGKKEVVERPRGRPLRMFVCGPTVYDNPHIGNARTFVFFDIFARYLRSRGFQVFFLQNITDVDDKIIARAKEQGVSWKKVAREYEKIFRQNLKVLNITAVDKLARATGHIPEIVRQVQTLVRKNHAYLIPDDGYYFDLSTFPDYGKLARRTAAQAEDATSRIDTSSAKRHKGDFCLWKLWAGDLTEPHWKTKLGEGRPGWHIEDTAISEKFFGPQYDIHGGAVDLKFPHHEAEIAQQESASGKKPFVKVWIHAGFLTVNGQKMSKSLHNFITINELLQRYSASDFRMAIFMHHYRSPMDFTDTLMETAGKNLENIRLFIRKLEMAARKNKGGGNTAPAGPIFETTQKKFQASLDDDFNSSEALAAVFEFINAVNPNIWKMPAGEAKNAVKWLKNTFKSLGVDVAPAKIPTKVRNLARKRELARRRQQFMQSDALRAEINALGYGIEDTPLGQLIYKIEK